MSSAHYGGSYTPRKLYPLPLNCESIHVPRGINHVGDAAAGRRAGRRASRAAHTECAGADVSDAGTVGCSVMDGKMAFREN